ncbi:MAG: hypothetical protein DMF44_15530 [Verrucomicrobia bacterium]|nr:MAG: hypothetical protein DMF44_15530 [Verrucomicrobiota bacterium]
MADKCLFQAGIGAFRRFRLAPLPSCERKLIGLETSVYPLSYGNSDNCDFRFDRPLQTVFDGCLAGRYSRNRTQHWY